MSNPSGALWESCLDWTCESFGGYRTQSAVIMDFVLVWCVQPFASQISVVLLLSCGLWVVLLHRLQRLLGQIFRRARLQKTKSVTQPLKRTAAAWVEAKRKQTHVPVVRLCSLLLAQTVQSGLHALKLRILNFGFVLLKYSIEAATYNKLLYTTLDNSWMYHWLWISWFHCPTSLKMVKPVKEKQIAHNTNT